VVVRRSKRSFCFSAEHGRVRFPEEAGEKMLFAFKKSRDAEARRVEVCKSRFDRQDFSKNTQKGKREDQGGPTA